VPVTISRVLDAADVALWHDVEARSVPIDQPGLVADPLEETLGHFLDDRTVDRTLMFLARDGDVVVGHAMVTLQLLDNLDNAMVHVTVVPEHRSGGIGRSIATFAIDVARAEGRSRAMGFVACPLDAESPGMGLAASLGARRANENLRRELDLTGLGDDALVALAREHVGDHAGGYEVVTWVDTAPDQLVDGAARLMSRMSTDAPQGDSSWEPERWDAGRYRELERSAMGRGRRRLVAGAVASATGELVAYSDIGVSLVQPAIAYQWDTVVDPAHRGNRLGLAIKIENLRQLRRSSPASARLETWNAASNSFMVAVNDALGFRPVQRTTLWQLDL
jgi:predicted N-acetyltransferase YhbS